MARQHFAHPRRSTAYPPTSRPSPARPQAVYQQRRSPTDQAVLLRTHRSSAHAPRSLPHRSTRSAPAVPSRIANRSRKPHRLRRRPRPASPGTRFRPAHAAETNPHPGSSSRRRRRLRTGTGGNEPGIPDEAVLPLVHARADLRQSLYIQRIDGLIAPNFPSSGQQENTKGGTVQERVSIWDHTRAHTHTYTHTYSLSPMSSPNFQPQDTLLVHLQRGKKTKRRKKQLGPDLLLENSERRRREKERTWGPRLHGSNPLLPVHLLQDERPFSCTSIESHGL